MAAIYNQALTDYREHPRELHKLYLIARQKIGVQKKAKEKLDYHLSILNPSSYKFESLHQYVKKYYEAIRAVDSTNARVFACVEFQRATGKYLRDTKNIHLINAGVEHGYVMRLLDECKFFDHDATSCYAASFLESVKKD